MQVNKIHFINIYLMIVLLAASCSNSDKTFMGMLYQLADIKEENREKIIQSWIKKQENFPIIENDKVYYIYKNEKDIPVFLTGDMNNWIPDSNQLMRIIGTSYYYFEQSYPGDARLEYKFIVEGKYLLDPLNEKTSSGGFGNNSLLLMPEYQFPTEVLLNRFQTYTTLDTILFKSKNSAESRKVFVFKHADAGQGSALIIFNDGGDYLSFAQTNIVLDNLIEQKNIPACFAIFVNPQNRMKELWFDDEYLRMLFKEIIPEIVQQYDLGKDNKVYFGGASLGGLTSFYALKKYSSMLDGVFGQSPSFWVDSLKIISELSEINLSEKKLYYDFGLFEEDSFDSSTVQFFEKKTEYFKIRKYSEGHAWGNWKGHLDNALIYLLNERTGS